MKNDREYFSVALSPKIDLAIPLESMGTVVQIETPNICLIPGVADFWYGTINFKGSLLWVLDSNLYFKLNNLQELYSNKHTAVIIKPDRQDNYRKVALIVKKLQGIIALNIESSEQFVDSKSTLEQCCSAIKQDEAKRTFILNPLKLLTQLYQHSALVST